MATADPRVSDVITAETLDEKGKIRASCPKHTVVSQKSQLSRLAVAETARPSPPAPRRTHCAPLIPQLRRHASCVSASPWLDRPRRRPLTVCTRVTRSERHPCSTSFSATYLRRPLVARPARADALRRVSAMTADRPPESGGTRRRTLSAPSRTVRLTEKQVTAAMTAAVAPTAMR